MHDSRVGLLEGRFRTLRTTWLAELPAGGWEGTSHQLGDELAACGERHRLCAYVPACPVRQVAGLLTGVLANRRFALTTRRTKSERLNRITRRPRGKRAVN
jgi:hypothetical protein